MVVKSGLGGRKWKEVRRKKGGRGECRWSGEGEEFGGLPFDRLRASGGYEGGEFVGVRRGLV